MSTNPKTHFRKVFKSDHLSVADLEDFSENGSDLSFTISHVRQEYDVKVAGRKGNFNIAYFKEKIKPLVLNATNSKVLKERTQSSFVEDWRDLPIQLYIDPNASIGGDKVGGVRIHPNAPEVKKRAVVTPDDSSLWNRAKNSFRTTGNLNKVKAGADISPELEQQLINEVMSEQGHA